MEKEKENFKRKDEGKLEHRPGKDRGEEKIKGKIERKGEDKERSEEKKDENNEQKEPIIRKSALARTPPMSRAPSTPDPKCGPGANTPVKKAESSGREEQKDREKEKRKKQLLISPTKKIGRTGSFSEVEGKINSRRSIGEVEGGNEKKKRKREDSNGGEEQKDIGTRTLIQDLKGKLVRLKTEMDNEVLKTAEMDKIMGEVMVIMEQVEAEEMVRMEEQKDGNLKQRRIMNGLIAGTNTYEQFREIEGCIWPRECFTKTIIKLGICPMGEGDIVIMRSLNDPDMEMGVAGRCRESFPELMEMNGENWETLIWKSKRILQNKREQERERRIHIAQEAEGPDLFEKLKKLRDYLNEMGRRDISMALEKHVNAEEIAKMLECILRNTDIKITLYSLSASKDVAEGQRVYQGNALIISSKTGNYAETLKKVKDELTGSDQDIMVKKIRSTRSGDMLIELKEGDDGTKVERALNGREGIEVKILEKDRGKRKKYIIRDLDADISKEEIEETIRKTAIRDDEAEEVKVLSIRKAYGDTQTAIIQINKEHGNRLEERGGVKFGLVLGILKEWVEVEKCYKCWAYGHRAPECTGPDRSNYCLRCGTEGHRMKDCSGEEFCPICQRQGHRAGSGACPKMRDMLAKLRRQEAERRRNRAK